MAPFPKDADAFQTLLETPPPPGSPYSVPIPGSEKEGRSAVYRHWRFRDEPLLRTLDPAVQTMHDAFEASVKRRPNNRCLGARTWNPVTKEHGKFEWESYAKVAERRRNLGVGIVDIHKKAGISADKFGIGLWCQNRPEWQITGMSSLAKPR